MLILISPAKTLDYQSPLATTRYTQPELLEYSQQLIGIARKLTAPQIGKLMSISDKLADLNATRFTTGTLTLRRKMPAAISPLKAMSTLACRQTLTEDDFDFAQQHLRMLSGLYGVLRPLDLMQPYRSRWGSVWKIRAAKICTSSGDTTEKLNQGCATGRRYRHQLASDEYFKSVKTPKLQGQLIAGIPR